MPALILRSQNIIAKTQHRPFIPKQGRGIGEFAYKIRHIVFLVVLIIIIPCYIAQGMANFSYGNEAVANSPGTPVYEAEQQMNAKFGKSNMMIALVPPDSNITEKKMTCPTSSTRSACRPFCRKAFPRISCRRTSPA